MILRLQTLTKEVWVGKPYYIKPRYRSKTYQYLPLLKKEIGQSGHLEPYIDENLIVKLSSIVTKPSKYAKKTHVPPSRKYGKCFSPFTIDSSQSEGDKVDAQGLFNSEIFENCDIMESLFTQLDPCLASHHILATLSVLQRTPIIQQVVGALIDTLSCYSEEEFFTFYRKIDDPYVKVLNIALYQVAKNKSYA